MPLTNHSDQAGLYHVHVYGVEANEQLTGLYPLTTSVQQRPAASSAQDHDHTHLLTRIGDRPKVIRSVEEIVFPIWSEENGQDDLVWYPAKKDSPWTFPTALSGSKHKGSGLFHLHVYQKKPRTTKRAIPHYLSSGKGKTKTHSTRDTLGKHLSDR